MERAFGVLQARFHIIKEAARLWKKKDLRNIIKTCIILHNMIIEDERDERIPVPEDYDDHNAVLFERSNNNVENFEEIRQNFRNIKDKEIHFRLQKDLIDHIWFDYGNGGSSLHNIQLE